MRKQDVIQHNNMTNYHEHDNFENKKIQYKRPMSQDDYEQWKKKFITEEEYRPECIFAVVTEDSTKENPYTFINDEYIMRAISMKLNYIEEAKWKTDEELKVKIEEIFNTFPEWIKHNSDCVYRKIFREDNPSGWNSLLEEALRNDWEFINKNIPKIDEIIFSDIGEVRF